MELMNCSSIFTHTFNLNKTKSLRNRVKEFLLFSFGIPALTYLNKWVRATVGHSCPIVYSPFFFTILYGVPVKIKALYSL